MASEKKSTSKAPFVERIIGKISPAWALSRAIDRARLDQIRAHEAAGYGRRHPAEFDRGGTANMAIGQDLVRLRSRSIHLLENNGYAAQAQDVTANGIVGPGIRPSVRGVSKEFEKDLLEKWGLWADFHECDYNERLNFYGIQQLVMRAVFSTGEAIVRRRRMRNGMIQLQVHEGDYLDMTLDGIVSSGGNYVQHGIEYNPEGKVVAYWLFDSTENYTVNLNSVESRRIPASEIIHVFYQDRAGRRRGLPMLRRAMVKLSDIARYQDAEMQGKIASACHAAFVSGSTESLTGFTAITEEDREEKLEPGMITYLRAGETATFNSPTHATGYGEFNAAQLREAAAGVGTSYEALTVDYSMVNFSSGRMGWIESGRNFAEKRTAIMDYFNNRAWSWFMESMALTGGVNLSRAEAMAIRADWTAPRREMLDPVKEAEGLRLQIAAGLISWQEAVRSLGGDPDDVSAELAKALGTMEEIDFTPTWMVPTMEINALALEADAKQTTAEAAKESAKNAGKNGSRTLANGLAKK